MMDLKLCVRIDFPNNIPIDEEGLVKRLKEYYAPRNKEYNFDVFRVTTSLFVDAINVDQDFDIKEFCQIVERLTHVEKFETDAFNAVEFFGKHPMTALSALVIGLGCDRPDIARELVMKTI